MALTKSYASQDLRKPGGTLGISLAENANASADAIRSPYKRPPSFDRVVLDDLPELHVYPVPPRRRPRPRSHPTSDCPSQIPRPWRIRDLSLHSEDPRHFRHYTRHHRRRHPRLVRTFLSTEQLAEDWDSNIL